MKTILVVAPHPDLAEAVVGAVNPAQYRVVPRATVEEVEPLLVYGLADICIVDIELNSVQGVWFLEKLRRHAPKCPVIIFTGAKQWEWEEEAYLQGAAHVLSKPVRPRLLAALLDRMCAAATPTRVPTVAPAPPAPNRPLEPQSASPTVTSHTLNVLRDFSGILTHSLNAEGMLKQFL